MKKYFNTPTILAVAGFLFLFAGSISAQTSPCGETDYDCKIKYYQDLIKNDPKNTEAYYNLGLMFQKKSEYAQSVAMFDLYLNIGISDPVYMADGYYNRGYSQQRLGKHDQAVSDFTKAISLVPTEQSFYRDRGLSYNDLKNFPSAIADFTKAIEMNKDYASAYFGRGFAYMGQPDLARATADFTKVLALEPDNSEAFYNRGTIHYRLKEYAPAITDLSNYIALNQADPHFLADGYNTRGLCYFYLENSLKAVDDFTKAIQLAPTVKNGYEYRARAYRKLNKIALAETDEKQAALLGK
jgi:tetratricopeptide (TPR) repeat protein